MQRLEQIKARADDMSWLIQLAELYIPLSEAVHNAAFDVGLRGMVGKSSVEVVHELARLAKIGFLQENRYEILGPAKDHH